MIPMHTIDLREPGLDPAALLDRVAAGESLVVVREGRPVAELRPLSVTVRQPRASGLAAGAFVVPADFDAPLADDVLRAFEDR